MKVYYAPKFDLIAYGYEETPVLTLIWFRENQPEPVEVLLNQEWDEIGDFD